MQLQTCASSTREDRKDLPELTFKLTHRNDEIFALLLGSIDKFGLPPQVVEALKNSSPARLAPDSSSILFNLLSGRGAMGQAAARSELGEAKIESLAEALGSYFTYFNLAAKDLALAELVTDLQASRETGAVQNGRARKYLEGFMQEMFAATPSLRALLKSDMIGQAGVAESAFLRGMLEPVMSVSWDGLKQFFYSLRDPFFKAPEPISDLKEGGRLTILDVRFIENLAGVSHMSQKIEALHDFGISDYKEARLAISRHEDALMETLAMKIEEKRKRLDDMAERERAMARHLETLQKEDPRVKLLIDYCKVNDVILYLTSRFAGNSLTLNCDGFEGSTPESWVPIANFDDLPEKLQRKLRSLTPGRIDGWLTKQLKRASKKMHA